MKCVTYKWFSFLAGMEYGDGLDVTDEDDYENWERGHNNSHGYPRLSDWTGSDWCTDERVSGNRTRSSSSGYRHYYTSACDLPRPPSVKAQAKESVSSRLFCLSCQVRWRHYDVMRFCRVQIYAILLFGFFFCNAFRILKEEPDYYKNQKKAKERLRRNGLRNR